MKPTIERRHYEKLAEMAEDLRKDACGWKERSQVFAFFDSKASALEAALQALQGCVVDPGDGKLMDTTGCTGELIKLATPPGDAGGGGSTGVKMRMNKDGYYVTDLTDLKDLPDSLKGPIRAVNVREYLARKQFGKAQRALFQSLLEWIEAMPEIRPQADEPVIREGK